MMISEASRPRAEHRNAALHGEGRNADLVFGGKREVKEKLGPRKVGSRQPVSIACRFRCSPQDVAI